MNSKFLLGIGVSVVIIVVGLYLGFMVNDESNSDALHPTTSVEHVREQLTDVGIPFIAVEYDETDKQVIITMEHKKYEENVSFFDQLDTPHKIKSKMTQFVEDGLKREIVGATAKNVCLALEISCTDEPVFDANFNPDRNISGFSYVKGDVQYTFNVRDDEIKYKIDEEDSQWMTFGDPSNHEKFSRHTDVSKKISEFNDAQLIVTNEPIRPSEVIKSITLHNVPYGKLVENEQEYVGNMLHYYGKISDVDRNTFTVSTAKIAVTPAAGWVDLIELTYNKFELTDDIFKEVWGTYRGVNEDTGLPMLQVFLIE